MKEKNWNLDHYDEFLNINDESTCLNLASSGYKVVISPSFYLEKFLHDYEDKWKTYKMKDDDIKDLKIPKHAITELLNLNNVISKLEKNYSDPWYDGRINSPFITTHSFVENTVETIIKYNLENANDNFENLSPTFISYVLVNYSMDINVIETFLEKGVPLDQSQLLYLLLKKPKECIRLYDKYNKLTTFLAGALLSFNPLTIYHFDKKMKIWNESLAYDEYMDNALEYINTYQSKARNINSWVDSIKPTPDEEKKVYLNLREDNHNDIIMGLNDAIHSHKLYYGFSYVLGLDNEEALMNFFLNQKNSLNNIHKVRNFSENMLSVKRPTTEDMTNFIDRILKITSTKKSNDYNIAERETFETYIKYINRHKKVVDPKKYDEITSVYYSVKLLDEMDTYL